MLVSMTFIFCSLLELAIVGYKVKNEDAIKRKGAYKKVDVSFSYLHGNADKLKKPTTNIRKLACTMKYWLLSEPWHLLQLPVLLPGTHAMGTW